MQTKRPAITKASDAKCELAENPLWHPGQHCVYWTDIPAGKIYRLNVLSGKEDIIYHGDPVGGFTFQQNDALLLFRVKDIAILNPNGCVSPLREFSDKGMLRFNDVIADPEGRVFAGTMGTHPDAGLYRMDLDGTIAKLFSGTGCSNGMGFSPDLKTFYWTCSTTRQIFRFDYNRDSGAITNRTVFFSAKENDGIPDGLTVDVEGCIWSARWAGASVVRHAVDGTVLNSIQYPVTNITSVCFGGEKRDQLFVTAARDLDKKSEPVTALFQSSSNVQGIGEFRSRIGLPLS